MIVADYIRAWKRDFRTAQYNMRLRKIEALKAHIAEERKIAEQREELTRLEEEKRELNPSPLQQIGIRIFRNLERNAEAQPNRVQPDNFSDYIRDQRNQPKEVNPWIRRE